jgi:hypothetical protein
LKGAFTASDTRDAAAIGQKKRLSFGGRKGWQILKYGKVIDRLPDDGARQRLRNRRIRYKDRTEILPGI